jgi:hypothetical protein
LFVSSKKERETGPLVSAPSHHCTHLFIRGDSKTPGGNDDSTLFNANPLPPSTPPACILTRATSSVGELSVEAGVGACLDLRGAALGDEDEPGCLAKRPKVPSRREPRTPPPKQRQGVEAARGVA